MFGEKGILKTIDQCLKSIKISQLATRCLQFEKFSQYFNSNLRKVLESDHYQAIENQLWSNNDSESMNHVIKNETDWEIKTVSQLVQVLKGIVERQYFDMKASLYGSGNYALAGIYTLYRVNFSRWNISKEETKDKMFNSLIEDSKKLGRNENDTKKKFKGVAKKPHQSRRPTSERVTKAKK